MAIWILLVVAAQFLNAITAVIDKYIVSSNTVPQPIAYAFYVTLLSALSILVFFFSFIPIPLAGIAVPSFSGIEAPTMTVLWTSFIGGLALFFALTAMFTALKRADASDVVPVVGACSAVGALVLSFLVLGSSLADDFLLGVGLLVVGTFVLSHFRFKVRDFFLAALAGFLFSVHFVGIKFLFGETTFDNAFFWSRAGIVVAALIAFLFPMVRKRCKIQSKKARRRAPYFILGNKLIAGLAGLMILKAIELGDVTVVQALGGLQFAFLVGFAAIFGKTLPQVCGEKCEQNELLYKTIAVSIIIVGFIVLFL